MTLISHIVHRVHWVWSIFGEDVQSFQYKNDTMFSLIQNNIVMQKKMRNHFPMCENMSRMTKGHSRLFSPTYHHHLAQNFNRKVWKGFYLCHLLKKSLAIMSSFYRKNPLLMIKEWENYRCSKCVAVNFHRSLYGNHLSKTSTSFFGALFQK